MQFGIEISIYNKIVSYEFNEIGFVNINTIPVFYCP